MIRTGWDIDQELRHVEEILLVEADDEWGALAEIFLPLVRAGGKRLRPLLVLSVAQAGDPAGRHPDAAVRAVQAAVAMELLHLGSLIHDDVIDQGEVRRGVPTANLRLGNLRAVLGGDVMFARSSRLAAELGWTEARLVAETLEGLCRGQIQESARVFDTRRSEADYLTAIEGKTGVLMGACCEIGARQAGIAPEAVRALRDFGLELGIAFQVMDDLLDLVAPTSVTGKARGQDLLEGVYTLPVITAMRQAPALAARLGQPVPPDDLVPVCDLIEATSGVAEALAVADQRAARAWAHLDVAAGAGVRVDALRDIGDRVLAGRDLLGELLDPRLVAAP